MSRRGAVVDSLARISSAPAEQLETRTLLAAQLISSNAPAITAGAGETFDVTIVYQTLNDSNFPAALQADGISFNLHFDSDALTFVETRNVFAEGLQTAPSAARAESDASVIGDDNDPTTDSVLLASYADTDSAQSLGWTNSPTAGSQVMYVARFTARAGFSGTTINFSANSTGSIIGQSGTFVFQSNSLDVQAPSGPAISIADATPVTEGGNAAFTVTLSSPSSQTVTVSYSTQEGNGPTGAIAGEDFVPQTNQSLTFNPGETQKTILISTIDDDIVDPDETFDVSLSNPVGAPIRISQATAAIVDNDVALPRLSIADAPIITEGENAVFEVTLNTAASQTITVNYSTGDGNGPTGATNGTDFTSQQNQTLTFAPGQVRQTITVATTDDALAEETEEFVVTLSAPSGATIARPEAVGTINDNDAGRPEISIANAPFVTEGGTATFTVSLTAAASGTVTVNYSTSADGSPTAATPDVDFTSQTNQTLTFNPGETEKTISISTTNDAAAEPTETFLVSIFNPNNAALRNSQAVGTILDDDSSPQGSGDVDGDGDFDANDSFLIHLVKLSGTNTQIDQSKGSSSLTAAQIRTNVSSLETSGDVDGDSDFDANDSFLIHLVKLSGTNTQIDQSKGSSSLTAAQIRTNVNNLDVGSQSASAAAARRIQVAPVSEAGSSTDMTSVSSLPETTEVDLFAPVEDAAPQPVASTNFEADHGSESASVWQDLRTWIDAI